MQTHTRAHTHTLHGGEENTWEADNIFLMTVRGWPWTPSTKRQDERCGSSSGLEAFWSEEWKGWARCADSHRKWWAESTATGFPVQRKLAQFAQNILIWWRTGSVTVRSNVGNNTGSLLHCSLIFLSLLSFLCLWQSHWALGSFLASHMVLIRKDK